MNLIEELAENLCSKLCPEWNTCKHEPHYCPEITNKAKKFLPVFAEWIKQVKNPYSIPNYIKEFEEDREVFLSELEKVK